MFLPPSITFVFTKFNLKMVQYVITPWRNRAELLEVRDKLYPSYGREVKEEERRHAVAKVSVWMQRGNCPHLVESTAILTAALLNDVSGNSTYCVRAAYSAAFCR
jgi:ribosomal biogenesis protein LAS1